MTADTVAIVGLGLIGGSLARDLTARGHRVVAVEPDDDSARRALAAGAVADAGPDLHRIREARCVIVAAPIDAAARVLGELRDHAHRARWITDVCGTKRSILRAAEAAGLAPRFVGSHPLAGGTGTGFAAARPGLFAGARVFLCAAEGAAPETMDAVAGFWRDLEAIPVPIPADRHDREVAWTSQLPQSAATLLALSLSRADVTAAALGPGGRDTIRLAASGPDMWTEILLDSGPLLLDALDGYRDALEELRHAVSRGDRGAIRRVFEGARAWAEEAEPR